MSGKQGNETELKIPVANLDPVRRRLLAARAQRESPPEVERNVLFDWSDRRLTAAGQALRLRQVGGCWVLTFKGPVSYQGQVKVREELELDVGGGEVLARLFARIGLEPLVRYEKERERWRLGEVEVALDRTAMGDFVELEGAVASLEEAAQALDLDPRRAVRGSYLSLWEKYRGQNPELDLPVDMVLMRR